MSPMADKKIIAVVGATGAQGGGLVRAILDDPAGGFTARAITRDVNSREGEGAGAGRRRGGGRRCGRCGEPRAGVRGRVRRVLRDLLLGPFLAGEGAGAARRRWRRRRRAAKLQHVIWSTLEDTRQWVPLSDNRMPTLMGKYKVPHFDAKGEANHFFTDAGVPTTLLLTSFYWDNFIYFGMGPKKGPDGKLALTLPMGDKKLPGIAAEDIGRCAYGIFKERTQFVGKTVGIAGEHLTGAEMAAGVQQGAGHGGGLQRGAVRRLSRASGSRARTISATCSSSSTTSTRCIARRATSKSRESLNPRLQTFEQWLGANAGKIAIG